jgi:arylsulfatase A
VALGVPGVGQSGPARAWGIRGRPEPGLPTQQPQSSRYVVTCMADTDNPSPTRRRFLKSSLAAAGALVAGGLGYRLVSHALGRQFDPARAEAYLATIGPPDNPGTLPNLVLIMVDDMGYGDLPSYGPGPIHTSRIDRMAAEGMRLTRAYATAPLCSPSRAGLLTGRYPIRTHVTMPLYPAGAFMDIAFNAAGVYRYGLRGIPEDELLLPELLQRRGYRTALLGKWHLGDRSPHLPTDNGFDLFYGALFSNDMGRYTIYRNEEVAQPHPVDQSHLTQDFTQAALAFIQENRDRPFFLYYAQPFPHIPLHASEEFLGRSEAGLYGDTVEEVDWSVGQILDALRAEGLDERTLVIFTSDNGPWWQGSPGGIRGRKNLPFDGGFRVPLIARWPGVIPEGTVAAAVSMNFDLFVTCLAAAGLPPPDDRAIDGQNLLPVFRGETESLHETLYYYKGARLVGVRHGPWKYLRRHMTDNGGYASLRQGPFLFHLERDPDESYNLIESEPEVAQELVGMLDDWDAAMARNLRGWR